DDVILNAALSPDGKIILTIDRSGAIRFWDAIKSEPLGPRLYHPKVGRGKVQGALLRIQQMLFSPNGKLAVTVIENQAQLWNTQTRSPLGQPLEHARFIYCVAFDPTGTMILTGSSDKTAQLWDVKSRARLGPSLSHPDTVISSAFSPDGKWIV